MALDEAGADRLKHTEDGKDMLARRLYMSAIGS